MNLAMRKIDLRPNLDSVDADRMLIQQTASYLKNLWSQVNAAEMYITAGGEFKKLHEHLSKNSKHDKNRIGWCRAFEKDENKFGCHRSTAEIYMAVHGAFFHVANAFATWKLPQSLNILHSLAKLKLSSDQLQQCEAEGLLKPDSGASDIRRIAEKFKLRKKLPIKKKSSTQTVRTIPSKNAPKRERLQAAFELLAKLGLTVGDLQKEFDK